MPGLATPGVLAPTAVAAAAAAAAELAAPRGERVRCSDSAPGVADAARSAERIGESARERGNGRDAEDPDGAAVDTDERDLTARGALAVAVAVAVAEAGAGVAISNRCRECCCRCCCC
jgi:hypothetical protein